MRIVAKTEVNIQGYFGRVYRNVEDNEYIVRVYFSRHGRKPEHQDKADYFTDNKADAIATMHQMIGPGM